MNSNDITVTEGRARKAVNDTITQAVMPQVNDTIKKAVEDNQIKTGVITKFYPYIDRAEVVFDADKKKALCKILHRFGGELIDLFTPLSERSGYDDKLRERYIVPRVTQHVCVLNIRDSDSDENLILGYYQNKDIVGLNPAKPGNVKIAAIGNTTDYYLKFGLDGFSYKSPSKMAAETGYFDEDIEPVEYADSDTVYTKEEVYNKEEIDDIIEHIPGGGGDYIEKSTTPGLVKNDGTIDTTSDSTFSGDYDDLDNKPSIPSKISDLSNDSDFIETSNTQGLVKNDGTIDTTSYSTFSGSYNNLTDKPSFTGTVTSDTSGAYELGTINISGSDVTIYGKDSNTNSVGYQLRTNSTLLTAADKTYRYRLLLEVGDGTYMPVNKSTSTSATSNKSSNMNSREFLLFGDIRYYQSTTVVDSGSTFDATHSWQQYNVSLGYSFNNTGSALTLTPNSPVFMVAKRSSSNPSKAQLYTPFFTQTLPNTSDGLLYIQLGYATSETQMELTPHHPIFEYVDGSIQSVSPNTHIHNPISYKHTDDLIQVHDGIGGSFDDDSYIQFYKIGKIVIAYFRVKTYTNLTTTYTYFVNQYPIPSAYRPKEETISMDLCHHTTETPSILTTRFNTNGTIEMRINTNTRVVDSYFTVVYVTD